MGDPSVTNSARAENSTAYSRDAFGPTSPTINPVFRSDIFGSGGVTSFGPFSNPNKHNTDRSGALPSLSAAASDPATFGMPDARPAPAIIIRRLSRNIGSEALNSMLIFAGDLIDTELIRSPYPEDHGFATAVARFRTQASALEAQQKLHGKTNTSKDGNMIVEVHSSSMANAFERRNTIDGGSTRAQTSSANSSNGSVGGPAGRSRYGSTFQSNDKTSPSLPPSHSANGEFPVPDSSAHFQNLFSPQSPLMNGYESGARVSGKSMINDDTVDEETGELLKDPLAYANANGGQHQHVARTAVSQQHQVPVSRFSNLSLNISNGNSRNGNSLHGDLTSPTANGFSNGRNVSQIQSPTSPTSGSSANGSYGINYTRPQYPPVNPADQNPPCNTLYVGNLPLDTSEDELKAVFSKQRGYKRLCFRTKQNGPMCFVEFEDVSFATKALNELYGHPLHNSVKGGIRLSFSKNPLGVRSGQSNGMGLNAAMNPHAMAPGYNGMMTGTTFSSVSGPPPGLGSASINHGGLYRGPGGHEGAFSSPFGLHNGDFVHQLGSRAMSAGGIPSVAHGNSYGRGSRSGYAEYTASR